MWPIVTRNDVRRPWTLFGLRGDVTVMTTPEEKAQIERRIRMLEKRVGFHMTAHELLQGPPFPSSTTDQASYDDAQRRLKMLEWRVRIYRRDW